MRAACGSSVEEGLSESISDRSREREWIDEIA
jgi:hypothetical protein